MIRGMFSVCLPVLRHPRLCVGELGVYTCIDIHTYVHTDIHIDI